MPVTSTPNSNNKRWWLWWPLLATLAWLVLQEQSNPNDTSGPSLPTRQQPGRMPTVPAVAQFDPTPLTLVPREQLLGTSRANTSLARRDLFVARTASPPPQAPMPATVDTPVAPALPYRYVGKQWDGQAWEVYAVSGDQTYVLREGTTLDDQYRVDRIAPPQATLTYLPLGTAQTLSIGDAR